MQFDQQQNTWTRVCPSCQQNVEHKSKAKCRDAENHQRPCVTCSRKNIGSRNAKLETCPICVIEFRFPDLENHAKSHGLSPHELWLKNPANVVQLCRCGCNQETAWAGWKQGYNEFIIGHNGKIYDIYAEEKAKQIVVARRENGGNAWESYWTGKTKETDTEVATRAIATSKGRKQAFDNGKITVWSQGKTKETDSRLASFSAHVKDQFAKGQRSAWHKNRSMVFDPRLKAISEALKSGYTEGRYVQWSKGKTKKTDERIAKSAAKRSKTMHDLLRFSDEKIQMLLQQVTRFEINTDEIIKSYQNCNTKNIKATCRLCSNVTLESLASISRNSCKLCDNGTSQGQREIAQFLQTQGFNIVINDRSVLPNLQEIDILLENDGFGVEFNGIFWHTENHGKLQSYHDSKTVEAAKKGIRLVHIFEDEWKKKPEIVKSLLLARLGRSQHTYDARKLIVTELTHARREKFFNSTHLEGDVFATKAWGLYCLEEAKFVAALSLRHPQHASYKAAGMLEIARFSTALNSNVRGGLSRLLAHAAKWAKEEGHKKLFTYVDSRIGSGHGYMSAGFNFIESTPPRFWWTDGHKRWNRFKFRAMPGKTQAEVAHDHGVTKIWGCSNLRFEFVL